MSGTFRFLHLADVHLETHFGGPPAVKERLRAATREAFARALDHARTRRLHAVLVAGDLFDDELLSLRVELELVERVRRLCEAGTWFVWATGNHDPGGPAHRARRLGLCGDDGWRTRVRVLCDPRPELVVVDDAGGRPVGLVAGAGHGNAREGANLAAAFPDGPPPAYADLPLVGLLHTQVARARAAAAHARYAPSTAADFDRPAYSYWALGHVHLRQRAVPGLPVWYAGNLQGRHAREDGPKGGLEVEASARLCAEPLFVPFAPVRWERARLALDPAHELDPARLLERLAAAAETALAQVAGEVVLRLELAGHSRLAPLLADPARRGELEEELAERCGALAVELDATGLATPRAPRPAPSPSSVHGIARELLARARGDDATLERIAPAELAGWPAAIGGATTAASGAPGAGAEASAPADRLAYLRALLPGLEEELERRFRPAEER